MKPGQSSHSGIKWLSAATGLAAAAYGAYAGMTWLSYGHAKLLSRKGADPLLDVFMPNYDVVARHSIAVEAAPETAYQRPSKWTLKSTLRFARFQKP
jgi:hypothetical protein